MARSYRGLTGREKARVRNQDARRRLRTKNKRAADPEGEGFGGNLVLVAIMVGMHVFKLKFGTPPGVF